MSWFGVAGSGSGVDLAEVYDHLAFSEYQLGNVKRATQYTRDLLQNGEWAGYPCQPANIVMVMHRTKPREGTD